MEPKGVKSHYFGEDLTILGSNVFVGIAFHAL
jgi:hypothetical protein